MDACELSIVIPCLNEVETIASCIDSARAFLEKDNIAGEIIVADNGSTDGSSDVARQCGARVVHVPLRGYGAASMGGIEAARGTFIIMGDADGSYDFAALAPFLDRLREGYDLVMGNRFRGRIEPSAMPFLNRYLGTPVLTWIARLFFKSPFGDINCGLRGFRRSAIQKLNLQTTGMEFASEMIVKAVLFNLRVAEVPTSLSPSGRSRPPHLRRWRDGWRHLRFLLIFSPRWLFLYPGIAMITVGIAVMLWLIPSPRTVFTVTFDVHTMLYAAMGILLGVQAVFFAFFSKVFASGISLIPEDARVHAFLKKVSLEKGIIVGLILCVLGVLGSVYAVSSWEMVHFGPLLPSAMMRVVIPSITAFTAGVQIVLGSFFLSILSLSHK